MRLFLIIAILISSSSCTASNSLEEHEKIKKLLKNNLQVGVKFDQIKDFILKYDKSFEIYNKCNEEYETKTTPCELGYSGLGRIPLSDAKSTADIAQVYYSFDSNLVLTNYSFEIYYENEHQ